MQSSASIAALAKALVAAQGELDNVAKDATNPHFRSTYASLPAILDTIRPVLAKNKLAVVQFPIDDEKDVGRVGVETVLIHESGEWVSQTYSVRLQKDDPQGAGSGITYTRRYALCAVLAIGQEDDDGEAGSGRAAPPQRTGHYEERRPQAPRAEAPRPAASASKAITSAQVTRLWAIAYGDGERAGLSREQVESEVRAIVEKAGFTSTKELPVSAYDPIIIQIQTTLRALGGDDPSGAFA
jgi:hypothetical protein